MLEALVAAALLLLVLLGASVWGLTRSAALLFLAVAMLLPRNLFVWNLADDFGYNVEIAAGAGPAVMTHGAIAIVAAVIIVLREGRRGTDWISLAALAYLLIGALFLWPTDLRVAGGVVYLATAVCAWIFGRHLGSEVNRDLRTQRLLAAGIAALMVAELALCLFQMLTDRVDVNGRPAGSFDHSGALGKNAIILLLLLLPFSRSRDWLARWSGWVGVAAAVAATVLTGSRANLLGVAIAIVLWVLLLPSTQVSLRVKVATPVVLLIVSAPFLPRILERFLADPDGGDRPELLSAGLRVISEHLWTGTGPNNYVATAALTEQIVQQTGYPIHNTYLFPVAALGIVGAIVFGMFLFVPLVSAMRVLLSRTNGDQSDFSRSFIVVFVALVPVAWTGWGLVGWNSLFLLMFCGGYAARMVHGHGRALSDRFDRVETIGPATVRA